jgi:hypothetical protein
MTGIAFVAYSLLIALIAMILFVMFDDDGGGPYA